MPLSGLMSVSPVQAGAPPLVRPSAAAHRSGLHTPRLLSPAPSPVPAGAALGETVLSKTVLVLICVGAGQVIPMIFVHLDALRN